LKSQNLDVFSSTRFVEELKKELFGTAEFEWIAGKPAEARRPEVPRALVCKNIQHVITKRVVALQKSGRLISRKTGILSIALTGLIAINISIAVYDNGRNGIG
jgi:hypothetical protein